MRHIRFFATLGLAMPVALLAGGCMSTPDTMDGSTDDPLGEAAQSLETDQACYGDHPRPTAFWAGAGNADDVYGAHNGTLGLGVTFASGKVGQAFAFNGLTDIRVADSPALTFPTAMTLEAWINPSNVLLTQAIIGKNRGLLGTGYNLLIGGGKLVFGMNNGSNFALASNATLSANTWTHVAATRNGNVVKLYINGVLDATSTSAFSSALIDSALPLTIGSEDTVLLRYFTGLIDEPAVWGADLTAAQIAGIYAVGAAGKCHCVPENDLCTTGKICSQTPSSYTCGCPAGFTGANCEINIDDCTAAPCQNGGTCVDGVNSYTCTCAAGFTGTHCEINIDECASAPCQNGGTCVDGVNSYTCTCAAGFTGTNCEINIDECASAPCQNGGTCADGVNGYTCTCATGFTGANCETNIDDCAGSPCLNGGTCVDGVDSYTCECADGYQGSVCQNLVGCVSGLPTATGFWKGENDAADSSGNGYNGTLRTGVAFAAGKVGQAFDTQNGDMAIATTATPFASLNDLTVDMWININDATGYQVLFSRNRGTGGTGYAVSLSDGQLGFAVNNGAGVNTGFSAPVSLSLHTWYHITVSRHANVVKLYVDCALVGQTSSFYAGTINLSSALPVTIGSEDTVGGRNFRGLIDEAAFYPTQLSDAEVSSICAAASAGVCIP
ncbi:LamG-like jellyroll fold domain-containing protein [Polyangium jinanense]|uniref:Uncharacterized protein n=1 Tax=Polyangium jinanense TaxID=2829994 RepID=A0A9X4AXS7_9BACT|nr:LamG-like jellyroll fold domain-containing protein [Polyangium jinanense]MDC3988943.1 hypothetical protein [Polyangium jinanense]